MHKEPSWKDVIDFADRAVEEIGQLMEEDQDKWQHLVSYMKIALELKQDAILEQKKEQA